MFAAISLCASRWDRQQPVPRPDACPQTDVHYDVVMSAKRSPRLVAT